MPDSELMRLCKQSEAKPAGPVKVSDDLFYVLAEGQEVCRAVGRGIRRDGRPGGAPVAAGPARTGLPDPDELAAALKRVGYKKMGLDPKTKTVELQVPGMQLDLGGIAKGYAADEGLKVLASTPDQQCPGGGGRRHRRVRPAAGQGRLEDRHRALPGDKEQRQLFLRDAAVVTSGDSEQFVEIAGVRYSHMVDPRTGLGLIGRRSVTVVARRGIQADSLTKVASILPADEAVKKIESVEGAATLIVVKTPKGEDVKQSNGFAERLAKD